MHGKRAFPPEAYLIGAQKAGTTSLAYLLQQHPRLALSNPKETHFFSVQFERGLGWYRDRFSFGDDQILLDGSTSYTMANLDLSRPRGMRVDVAKRIHDVRADAKFVYILRDPVERAISAYWHQVRFAKERRPIREAVSAEPVYIWAGQYWRQLERYLDHFDRSAFLLLDFRELERDPAAMAGTVVEFLGLSRADASFRLDEPKNRGFQFTGLGRALRRTLGSEARLKAAARLARNLAPGVVYRSARRLLTAEPEPISAADRAWLREFFHRDAEEIEKFCGLSVLDESTGA